MSRPAFDALDRDWSRLNLSPDGRRALGRWRSDPDLRADTLDELVGRIWALPMLDADRTCARLAARAADDTVAARVLLQALRPGLRALGRQLAFGAAFDDVDHELLALAWELIRTYPIDRRPAKIAPNVLLDVRKRYVQAVREGQHTAAALEELPVRLQPTSPSAEHDALEAEAPSLRRANAVLRNAVDGGSISATAADIVWRTRVIGVSDSDAADDLGLRLRTLQRRRQRAERRLAAAS